MKPIKKVEIRWSPSFAYIIGLITSDGNLSKDNRHINFTSKDLYLAILFKNHLKIDNKIGKKSRSNTEEKKYYFIQIGDVNFYRFLTKIGLKPNKSKKLNTLNIPQKYFFDFLRGVFDGDGSVVSSFDKRWKNSFVFYLVFYSASPNFIDWLRKNIELLANIKGHINKSKKRSTIRLKYGKKEATILVKNMYYKKNLPFLERKYSKIKKIIDTENKIRASGGTGRLATLRGL